MNELRKVTFCLKPLAGTMEDIQSLGAAECERVTKERQGLFHCFGTALHYCAQDEKWHEQIMAFIEECETGQVHHVVPECVTFLNRQQ